MDLSFTPEQNAFRGEVTEWIQSAMPPELREKADKGAEFEQSETLQWHKILFEKGWIAPGWPEEIGGTGWDVGQRFIFQEECIRANTPELSPFGLSMVGPLIIQYGDDEQKERFLPKILSGEEIWCQGYSEPNAGSDLAALQLRAELDGDHYVLNGQKTWTTYAQYAKWIFVLARTSTAGKKQEGISFLLANIDETPGIDVKPFLTTGGTLAFSETWFKDARVPVENRVGPENAGWTMAKALLGHERTLIGGIAESGKWLALCKRIAKETPVGKGTLFDDAAFRSRIARL
jgi:alkylation response protein AidB-like acyl-CoA dehydrogenase